MSLTIDEAIARFEANAEQNERWASGGLNPEANAEYAAEHKQLAEWLRELAERRKEPEKAQLSQEGTTSDLISRQAAIDALDCINGTEEVLRSLPSAQPEPKEGEWVQIQRCTGDAQPDLECPFCKHRIGWFDMGRYCAGCGAKLKGGAR